MISERSALVIYSTALFQYHCLIDSMWGRALVTSLIRWLTGEAYNIIMHFPRLLNIIHSESTLCLHARANKQESLLTHGGYGWNLSNVGDSFRDAI